MHILVELEFLTSVPYLGPFLDATGKGPLQALHAKSLMLNTLLLPTLSWGLCRAGKVLTMSLAL